MKTYKSQTSVEFLSSIVVVMFFTLAVYVVILAKISPAENAKNVCKDIASAINSAVFFGYGYSQNMTIPVGIEISATNTTLTCKRGETFIEVMNSEKIRNSTAYAPFEISAGKRQIKNTFGTIIIQ